MQQASNEERITALESELTALRQLLAEKIIYIEQRLNRSEGVDSALLIRIDSFITDLHRIERDQKTGFDTLRSEMRAGQADTARQFANVTQNFADVAQNFADIDQNFGDIRNILADHKQGIESLAEQMHDITVGQTQIIELLRSGQPRRND